MTLKPSKKKHNNNKKKQTKKKTKKREKKTRKTKNTQKWAFQLSVKIFLFFGWVSKISLFDNLARKARTLKTLKIEVSGSLFWKTDVRHETAIFGPKKQNSQIPVIIFLPVFYSFNNRKHKKMLKTLFL